MDNLTISAMILFGGGSLALIIGYYFITKLADKEQQTKV